MKIKNLLLGSVVAMGLSTGAAFAADPLGVLTSLDVCDSLGISGLTISSDTNCLAISGSVNFEYGIIWSEADDESTDEITDLSWDLTFDAANSTEFGPAHAIITLENIYDVPGEDDDPLDDDVLLAGITEAYVSIGDQTVIAAGLKDSITDDYTTTGFVLTKRTYFESQLAGDSSFRRFETNNIGDSTVDIGDIGISIVHQFGDGFSAGVGLESLEYTEDPNTALVGFVAVEQEMWSGYIAAALDEVTKEQDAFEVAVGISGEFDAFSFKAAATYADNDWDVASLEALLSAQAELDIVTLAAEFVYTDGDADNAGGGFFSATGSASFGVTDTADIAFALRYEDVEGGANRFGGEAQVVADITETLEGTIQGYFWESNAAGDADSALFGIEGSLVWNPDGDDNFEATAFAGFNNEYEGGAFYVGTALEKAFE